MPVDWEELDNEIDGIIEAAAQETDEALASKVSSLTKMTDDEIKELFPAPADVKKLSKLMKIVKSADDRNTKINQIVGNAEDLAGVVITLVDKFV